MVCHAKTRDDNARLCVIGTTGGNLLVADSAGNSRKSLFMRNCVCLVEIEVAVVALLYFIGVHYAPNLDIHTVMLVVKQTERWNPFFLHQEKHIGTVD